MARAPFLTNRAFNIDMDKLLCYKLWNILYFKPRNVLEDIWQVNFHKFILVTPSSKHVNSYLKYGNSRKIKKIHWTCFKSCSGVLSNWGRPVSFSLSFWSYVRNRTLLIRPSQCWWPCKSGRIIKWGIWYFYIVIQSHCNKPFLNEKYVSRKPSRNRRSA